MKHVSFIIVMLFFINCKQTESTKYDNILKLLRKNYTLENHNKNDLDCWKVNEEIFVKDSLAYRDGLILFYKQGNDFIKFLINKKSAKNSFNNWIKTKNPCDSNFEINDRIDNQKGVIILIDNLICNKNKKIIVNDYIDKIKFECLKKILLDDEKNSFDQIGKKYILYVQKIK